VRSEVLEQRDDNDRAKESTPNMAPSVGTVLAEVWPFLRRERSRDRQNLRRALLRRIGHRLIVERLVELQTVGQHNEGLRVASAFVHGEPDRLCSIREPSSAPVTRVFDDPPSMSILPDEQTRADSPCGFDALINHDLLHGFRPGSCICPPGRPIFREPWMVGGSMGRRSHQKLRRQREAKRDQHQHSDIC
jgi:hypothetical protein